MAVIRCKGRLWQRLGVRRETTPAHPATFAGVLLGSWGAKLFRDGERYLVIAVNDRTCLTALFPFEGRARFSAGLCAAVGTALRDLGIAEPIVRAECAALEFMPAARLGAEELADILEDVQYMCEIELCYHADLRIVQRNLNDFPHPNRDPCVPLEAVHELFHNAGENAAWLRSIA
ncbi:MAG TPA: hypothetical protein VNU64_19340 [Burkholderiales bacterium]|nr:hypothetical protein [Burkholderiales bacterium]